MTPDRAHSPRGFTLIELLVAVAIFAILGVMAYSGLNAVLNTQEHARQVADRLQALQFAIRMLERDLRFFAPRAVRNAFGDREPPLAVRDDAPQLVFTHAAGRNPAGLPRTNLRRVAYLLEDDTLLRVTWTRLDGASEEERIRTVLLDGVERFEVRVLPATGSWTDRWPGSTAPEADQRPYPRAVEIVLAGTGWNEIRRIIPLAVQRPAQTIQQPPPSGAAPGDGPDRVAEGNDRGGGKPGSGTPNGEAPDE